MDKKHATEIVEALPSMYPAMTADEEEAIRSLLATNIPDDARDAFMNLVYDELHSDGDNNRANRIIEAADEYAESAQLGTNLADVGTDVSDICVGDMISRQEVMDAINGIECTRYTTWYEFYQKVITAVGKLPPAQPEQTNCDYCHEDVDGYVKPIEKNGHAFVRFGMNGWELELKAKGWHGEAKIQYCPMCGRKL